MTRSPLTTALEQRGFALHLAVDLQAIGRRRIQVIKAVRSLTGWGLQRAEVAVSTSARILDGVEVARAEAAAQLLEAAGAEVELGIVDGLLLAYDPKHPRRAAQPLARLRVRVEDGQLRGAHERGHLGAWPDPGSGFEVFADADELLAFVDDVRRAWEQAGLLTTGDELALLQAVSAREPALEARLRAADDEALPREAAVYGDWLQAQGDPRGLIAAVALALGPDADGDAPTLAAALREHAGPLFGPVPVLVRAQAVQTRWTGPLLRTLSLADEGLADHEAGALLEVLRLPIAAALRELDLGRPFSQQASVGAGLPRAACALSLRRLEIHGGRELQLRGDLPALEQLTIVSEQLVLAARLPRLRRVSVTSTNPGAELWSAFTELAAPALEEFELAVVAHAFWDQHHGPLQHHLRRILALPSFARLRSLRLISPPHAVAYYGGLAAILAECPARATLARIDLRQALLEPRAHEELTAAALPGLLLPP